MKHGSGGLPDTKGPGSSDVDICVMIKDHSSLQNHFPADTIIDRSSLERTVYTLKGYDREVNIYCTAGDWWQNGYLHRQTELALNEQFPDLSAKAFQIKKEDGLSTEEAWAKVLGLGNDYYDQLLSKEKIIKNRGATCD